MLLRLVSGRPISKATCAFLSWACQRLWEAGKRVLVLIWDNASWHVSQTVQAWVKEHNRGVKSAGAGLRLLLCALPKRSPWLNRIEGKWTQGKRALVEPQRVLSPEELSRRICCHYGCEHLEPLQQ